MGLNPSTIYWMDIFSLIFVVKVAMFDGKDENKQKDAADGPFYKNYIIQGYLNYAYIQTRPPHAILRFPI